MKIKSNSKLFWKAATFSLTLLLLVGFTNDSALKTSHAVAEEPIENSTFSSEPFLGEITMFAGNFAPRGWAFCNGQLLPIAQNTALFSILGTTYGGDGRTTFGLPDLRGRVPIHAGTGPGLENYRLGQKGGGSSLSFQGGSKAMTNNTGSNKVLPADVNASNYQPFQTINFIIALQGTFPSRS